MNKTSSYHIEETTDVIIKIITFVISPFLSFLYSLRTMDRKSSYVVFFLFSVFFGMAFSVAGNLGEMEYYLDGVFYRMDFEKYCRYSYGDFIMDWDEYVGLKGDIKDFYFNVVAYSVSRVSDNYHLMFAVLALVFAYFQLKSLSFFTSEKNYRNCLFILILALIFCWNQIFNINGVRYNTAAWVYVYCVFQLFLNNNKRYFFLLALTPFIHASFYVYSFFLIIAYWLKNKSQFWKVAFIVSFFVSSISTVLVRYVQAFLPDVLASFVDSYTSGAGDAENSFVDISSISGFLISISSIYANFLMLWIIIKYRKDNNERTNSIYSAFLILATFMNFFMPISSLGGRMVLMVYPLMAFMWLKCFGVKYKYNWLIYIFPFVFIISLRTRFQQYLMVTNISFWISNPLRIISQYLL